MPVRKKSIVIIGAGPIGLETALYGACLGHDVHVLESGRVGQHLRGWGHVTLFSPFALNHSSLGATEIERAGVALPANDAYLSGAEHVQRYLEPLAGTPLLRSRVHERTRVVQVGRERIGKSFPIGATREHFPFRLLLSGPDGERTMNADVVCDCSGTYTRHNWLGSGNIPALGERALAERIDYRLQDLLGAAARRFAGRRVLLVGCGHSAATALTALTQLSGTSVLWLSRNSRAEPYTPIAQDPLPQRSRLMQLANELARGSSRQVEFRQGTAVEQLQATQHGFHVTLRGNGSSETVAADRVLAHVGCSPDNSLYRELQVHECYASFGPMNLAAALLAEGAVDCLARRPQGAEVLRNPEPWFFLLGAKSYGKNSSFLIRSGLEQVREMYTMIEERPGLDLYTS